MLSLAYIEQNRIRLALGENGHFILGYTLHRIYYLNKLSTCRSEAWSTSVVMTSFPLYPFPLYLLDARLPHSPPHSPPHAAFISLPMRSTTPIMFFLSVGSCSLCSLVKIDLLYTEMSSFIHGVAYVRTSFFFSLNNIPCVHIQHLDCLHIYWWTSRSWAAEWLKECYHEYQ